MNPSYNTRWSRRSRQRLHIARIGCKTVGIPGIRQIHSASNQLSIPLSSHECNLRLQLKIIFLMWSGTWFHSNAYKVMWHSIPYRYAFCRSSHVVTIGFSFPLRISGSDTVCYTPYTPILHEHLLQICLVHVSYGPLSLESHMKFTTCINRDWCRFRCIFILGMFNPF